jgi:ABC-type transporter Mla MlaB component
LADPDQPPASGPPQRGAGTARLVLTAQVGVADVPRLCERADALLRDRGVGTLECDAGCVAGVDLGTIEALARLTLVTRRHMGRFTIAGASPELRDLLDLTGLGQVVPCVTGSGGKASG